VLLSHADRTRVIAHDHRARVFTKGAVLVDGFVRGTWVITRRRDTATVLVEPFELLSRTDRTAVIEEAARLVVFAATYARARDVRIVADTTQVHGARRRAVLGKEEPGNRPPPRR
jgi:Winged helix DNA-binding domain